MTCCSPPCTARADQNIVHGNCAPSTTRHAANHAACASLDRECFLNRHVAFPTLFDLMKSKAKLRVELKGSPNSATAPSNCRPMSDLASPCVPLLTIKALLVVASGAPTKVCPVLAIFCPLNPPTALERLLSARILSCKSLLRKMQLVFRLGALGGSKTNKTISLQSTSFAAESG